MKSRLLYYVSVHLALLCTLFLLSGCGNSYTEAEIEDAKEQAYNEGYGDARREFYNEGYEDGYEEGFESGYSCGATDQREFDCEDLVIDGLSIRSIVELAFDEYGITPHEAFSIIDEYEYDSSHGGYSWNEYQNAVEAMYFVLSLFPEE